MITPGVYPMLCLGLFTVTGCTIGQEGVHMGTHLYATIMSSGFCDKCKPNFCIFLSRIGQMSLLTSTVVENEPWWILMLSCTPPPPLGPDENVYMGCWSWIVGWRTSVNMKNTRRFSHFLVFVPLTMCGYPVGIDWLRRSHSCLFYHCRSSCQLLIIKWLPDFWGELEQPGLDVWVRYPQVCYKQSI